MTSRRESLVREGETILVKAVRDEVERLRNDVERLLDLAIFASEATDAFSIAKQRQ
jgi:hypothetical protein